MRQRPLLALAALFLLSSGEASAWSDPLGPADVKPPQKAEARTKDTTEEKGTELPFLMAQEISRQVLVKWQGTKVTFRIHF